MYRESAIHYMGTKYRLLPQMLPFFPTHIHNFYDLFGGSGTVSLNVKADNYYINDLNIHVYNLYDLFKTKSAKEIIDYCYQKRDEYGFSINETDKKKIAELNKEPFQKCRDDMNKNPNTLGYYFLTFYSFCNQFRFSKNGFNMPVGNGYFKKESEKTIIDMCEFFSRENVYIFNNSYENFIDFNTDCFCYFDIPYSNCDAVYNEKRSLEAWGEKQDYEFFKWCELLNSKGVKWAISNVFCNKGQENIHLMEWCKKNNWVVHHLSMTYAGHSRKSANMTTDEVLICNYGEEDKTIFDL